MSAPSQSSELAQWPTLDEAAARLATSAKTIQRRIAAGEIEARKRPRPGKKPETVCNPRDIEKLLPAAHLVPATNHLVERKAVIPPLELLAAAFATMAATPRDGTQSQRCWLTLEEAAGVSGLSETFLRRLIRDKRITAIKDRSWKISHEALKAWQP